MNSRFRPLTKLSNLIPVLPRSRSIVGAAYNPFISKNIFCFSIPIQNYHQIDFCHFTSNHKPPINSFQLNPCANSSTDDEALKIQTLLKLHSHKPMEEIEQCLYGCDLLLSKDLIINVLKRHRSDWKPAYAFFKWVCIAKNSNGFSPDTSIYNEILEILGRMKQFDEVRKVLDEMSTRKNLIDRRTYAIVVSRFSAAHKVEEAVEFFHKVEDFGLERDLIAFQTLLLSLCRYKHVEAAELLFRNKRSGFGDDIKTWNIILNGWCVLGSLPDAKRFWKDIVASNCQPDKYTYGIFINSLSKSGKISTAMKFLRTMWEKGCSVDVAICNTVIDGLCFKKRIPEALQIFHEMNERSCTPNAATYNSLIKHLCKIQRMEKVHELLNEMEEMGDSCLPNALTYNYLLNAAKKREEVDKILQRMERSGCKLLVDTYNLILRLFMEWGDEERVNKIWGEMEMSGKGPDQRSYTVMIHGLYDYGRTRESLKYFTEMTMKGMTAEPRTKLLMDDINFKLKGIHRTEEIGLGNCNMSLKFPCKQGKTNR